MFKEPELINLFKRMASFYIESYPNDKESVERFLRWVLKQWGYQDGNT